MAVMCVFFPQGWCGGALLSNAGLPPPGCHGSGGHQGLPDVGVSDRHLHAARHLPGDLRCQSNPHPCREGQFVGRGVFTVLKAAF